MPEADELAGLTKPQLKERVVNLVDDIFKAKQEKRDVVGAHTDNIKRLEAELKELNRELNSRDEEAAA